MEIKTYEDGLKEAWDVAVKIGVMPSDGGIDTDDLMKIFGIRSTPKIFAKYTVKEAIEKIESWECGYKIGDEVEFLGCCERCGVVTKVYSDRIYVLWKDTGSVSKLCACEYEIVKKTGNNYKKELDIIFNR